MHASALSLFVCYFEIAYARNTHRHTFIHSRTQPLQPADLHSKQHQVSDAAVRWQVRPEASIGFMVYMFKPWLLPVGLKYHASHSWTKAAAVVIIPCVLRSTTMKRVPSETVSRGAVFQTLCNQINRYGGTLENHIITKIDPGMRCEPVYVYRPARAPILKNSAPCWHWPQAKS